MAGPSSNIIGAPGLVDMSHRRARVPILRTASQAAIGTGRWDCSYPAIAAETAILSTVTTPIPGGRKPATHTALSRLSNRTTTSHPSASGSSVSDGVGILPWWVVRFLSANRSRNIVPTCPRVASPPRFRFRTSPTRSPSNVTGRGGYRSRFRHPPAPPPGALP